MHSSGSPDSLLRRLPVLGTIRKKTLAILAATFFSSFLLLHTVSQYILLQSFKELEIHTTKHGLTHIRKELDVSLEVLDTLTRDWAWWDDAGEFVANPTPEFIAANLGDETFVGMKVDLIGFFAPDGREVALHLYDADQAKQVEPPASLREVLQERQGLVRHDDPKGWRMGIVVFPQGPMLFASRPILTSNQEGPVQGCVIFGRFLSGGEMERIAQEVDAFLKVTILGQGKEGAVQQGIVKKMQEAGETMVVSAEEGKSITGAMLIDDLFGKPALLFEATMQRSVFECGQRAISVLRWLFFGVSGLVCLVVMLLLDRLVIRPVVVLNDAVSRIGEEGGRDGRIASEGPAEIRRLADAINTMLDGLARANQLLAGKNVQLEREITERKELEQEREKLIAKLQEALAQVKTLSGFLPICASCKKIRDDSGYWKQIESYLSDHADVTFSHGICPDCAKKLYGDFIDVDAALKKK
ncbi:MAG: HAMP domain-containing protein [Proteobacteria bacterium]|nr:HAMP domain-containing protein [Pseudomonadota bacterium]MBU2618488.1 HAMP domain-containing protein [Pseudomonadota bacterium]